MLQKRFGIFEERNQVLNVFFFVGKDPQNGSQEGNTVFSENGLAIHKQDTNGIQELHQAFVDCRLHIVDVDLEVGVFFVYFEPKVLPGVFLEGVFELLQVLVLHEAEEMNEEVSEVSRL